MRIKFSGSIPKLDPILLIYPTPGTFAFAKADYPDHNIYDVIVIGAGGGEGGGLHGNDPDNGWETYAYGGAGGGGGFHRIRGVLDVLASSIDIIVGAAGAAGTDGADVPADATDGGDGGFSSFGGFVIAGGGEGGKRAQTLSYNENQLADGGSSGVGGRTSAGGAARGGICEFNANIPPEITDFDGADGKLVILADSWVGAGGGGGAGGRLSLKDGDWQNMSPFPRAGGKGSYNFDELVTVPGSKTQFTDPQGITKPFYGKPGKAGGARATPLTRSMRAFGNSNLDGVVVVYLTVD